MSGSLDKSAGLNEKDMFEIVWESGILGSIANAFEYTDDLRALNQCKDLVIELSKICCYYCMTESINKLINTFSKFFIRSSDDIATLHRSPKAQVALETVV